MLHRLEGVLVIGGGYAGLHAARAVRQRGLPVTVVDSGDAHGFITRLASVAGGTAPVSDAAATIDSFVPTVITGRVVEVRDGDVLLEDGRRLRAPAVVVTTGSVPARPDLPGLEHARTLRTAADAVRLRAEIARAESLVIIGAGASGTQLAGSASYRHRRLDVTIVDRESTLLSTLSVAAGRQAARILRRRGVTLDLGNGVASIDQRGLETSDGRRHDGLVVWTGGFSVDSDLVPGTEAGPVDVDEMLRIRGTHRTFAAGDLVAHVDGRGDRLPMSAQIAVQAGAAAGANAARLVQGRELKRANLQHLGWVLDLGGGRGIAEFGPVSLAAPLLDRVAPLLHAAIDVRHLIQVGGVAGLRFVMGAPRRPAVTANDTTAVLSRAA